MMRAAIIEAGKVANVVMLNDLSEAPGAVASDTANIGDTYDGTSFTPPAPPAKTAMQTVVELQAAVQRHMDAAATAKGYDSILSACSYAGADNPFKAEGAAFLTWRAGCWAHCYTVLSDVTAGTREAPTADALIAELPALVMPG